MAGRPKKSISNDVLVKTVSIQGKVIAANAKVEDTLNQLAKLPEVFAQIKAEVEASKGEMDLGLKQYEAEIQNKRDQLSDDFTSETLEQAQKLLDLKQQVLDAEANQKRQLEEVQYNGKLAIDRENLSVAQTIAAKKRLILVDDDTLTKHNEEVAKILKDSKADLAIAVSSAVKNAKTELASEISSRDTSLAILNNNLSNANEKVATLEAQINYLKTQLDAEREASVARLAAAKVQVTQSNQGK